MKTFALVIVTICLGYAGKVLDALIAESFFTNLDFIPAAYDYDVSMKLNMAAFEQANVTLVVISETGKKEMLSYLADYNTEIDVANRPATALGTEIIRTNTQRVSITFPPKSIKSARLQINPSLRSTFILEKLTFDPVFIKNEEVRRKTRISLCPFFTWELFEPNQWYNLRTHCKS